MLLATLTISYDNKTPVVTWSIYAPSTPIGYYLYWGTSYNGPWVKVSDNLIAVLFKSDPDHSLSTERRIYYKVNAVLQDLSEVYHAGPSTYSGEISKPFVNRIVVEIKRRHDLMLDKFSGESCSIYFRRAAGVTCSCVKYTADGARLESPYAICPGCYNTGLVGGYVKETGVKVRIRNAQETIEEVPAGIKLTDLRQGWVGEYPPFDVGDFIERPNGERFSVVNTRRRELQGHLTFQVLSLIQIEPENTIYTINL